MEKWCPHLPGQLCEDHFSIPYIKPPFKIYIYLIQQQTCWATLFNVALLHCISCQSSLVSLRKRYKRPLELAKAQRLKKCRSVKVYTLDHPQNYVNFGIIRKSSNWKTRNKKANHCQARFSIFCCKANQHGINSLFCRLLRLPDKYFQKLSNWRRQGD